MGQSVCEYVTEGHSEKETEGKGELWRCIKRWYIKSKVCIKGKKSLKEMICSEEEKGS